MDGYIEPIHAMLRKLTQRITDLETRAQREDARALAKSAAAADAARMAPVRITDGSKALPLDPVT